MYNRAPWCIETPSELTKILANHFLVFVFAFVFVKQTSSILTRSTFASHFLVVVFVFVFSFVKKTSSTLTGFTFASHFLVVGPQKLLKGPSVWRFNMSLGQNCWHIMILTTCSIRIAVFVAFSDLASRPLLNPSDKECICFLVHLQLFPGSKKCGKAQLQVTWCHSQYGLIGCARNSAQPQVREEGRGWKSKCGAQENFTKTQTYQKITPALEHGGISC